MIFGSPELYKFVVEPWMKLEPFDPKLIKELDLNHPYKIILSSLYNYSPSYNSGEGNDTIPGWDGDEDATDFYFKMLDDYNRYGIAFDHLFNILPDNKLGVFEDEENGKPVYYLVDNWCDKKILLFNNVKTIDLNKHDRGEKPLTEEEKQKRNLIKTQKNKKLQVALMDPDVYNNPKLFKDAIETPEFQNLLIRKFNYRMSWQGLDDFLRIKFD